MNNQFDRYADFFEIAFGKGAPFDYQTKLATGETGYGLVNVPTGAGKTAALLGMWLWLRLTKPHLVGRRLIFCLPMRTLVEQTAKVAGEAVERLGLANRIGVHVLMGGSVSEEWEHHPEKEFILIGTQDMLVSRALNRGYAMSRFRWPIHFALLNNDCLWVMDEIQLMGDGLATTTQLAAFREKFGTFGDARSIWMSATLDRDWLNSIDFRFGLPNLKLLELSDADLADETLGRRLNAIKFLAPAPVECRTPAGLARFVKERHKPGTQTLVVVNRVLRAREVYDELSKLVHPAASRKKPTDQGLFADDSPELKLIHSRFRPAERKAWTELFESPPGEGGRIIVATQVVEAGVDITSRLLVTDLAPYSSLVQRFGRCNRTGESSDAEIFWVDRPLDSKTEKLGEKADSDADAREKIALPYVWESLENARDLLAGMTSAAPNDLPKHTEPFRPQHVLRRRDLLDLFDTTPDLSGYDLDVSRFVRGADERDLSVAWRQLDGKKPDSRSDALRRDELCPVSIGDLKGFIDNEKRPAWTWDALEGEWNKIGADRLRPGMTILFDVSAGGYDPERGWTGDQKSKVEEVPVTLDDPPNKRPEEDYGSDPDSFPLRPNKKEEKRKYKQTLAAHSLEARRMVDAILNALENLDIPEPFKGDMLLTTHHHDWGKVHHIFQETLRRGLDEPLQTVVWAKSDDNRPGENGRFGHGRPSFRHELASALALLQTGASDLTVYLAACHHGKVRLSIRAMPGEPGTNNKPARFARGIHEGDTLEATDLGDGVMTPIVELSLAPMELGRSDAGEPSWLERMLALRDDERLGVFRLAFLESLVRAADVRASMNPIDVWEEEKPR